jgi:hypothetical protein
MKVIGLKQAIFYLSETEDGFKLVDMRLALDRFCGPGAINDYFGRQGLAVQKMINEPLIMTDENITMLLDGKGDYAGPLVIKPSAFKFTMVDEQPTPLYGVLREIKIST